LLVHGGVPTVEEVTAAYQAVSHDDLRRVAVRLLDAPMSLAVVGPFTEAQVGRWVA
jgi:predicted Zn-dependent peptidase